MPQQDFEPQYDATSTERYVDSTSQKSEFDRVLDELERISQDTLAWDILRVTKNHFGDTEEENARKMEAFLGGFIINAATALHDKGLTEAAFKKLEEARRVLEMRQKLAVEVETIRTKVEENSLDLSDIPGLFDE